MNAFSLRLWIFNKPEFSFFTDFFQFGFFFHCPQVLQSLVRRGSPSGDARWYARTNEKKKKERLNGGEKTQQKKDTTDWSGDTDKDTKENEKLSAPLKQNNAWLGKNKGLTDDCRKGPRRRGDTALPKGIRCKWSTWNFPPGGGFEHGVGWGDLQRACHMTTSQMPMTGPKTSKKRDAKMMKMSFLFLSILDRKHGPAAPQAYGVYVNASKGNWFQKIRVEEQMRKGQPRVGDNLVLTIGSLMVAIWVTIVRSITLADNLVDVPSVVQQSTRLPSGSIPPSPSPRLSRVTSIKVGESTRHRGVWGS